MNLLTCMFMPSKMLGSVLIDEAGIPSCNRLLWGICMRVLQKNRKHMHVLHVHACMNACSRCNLLALLQTVRRTFK